MLTWEFYALNTTTFLLWLFQNWSHDVLTLVFALGAVCVLGLSVYIVFRVVHTCIRVLIFLFSIVFGLIVHFFTPPRRSRRSGGSLPANSYPLVSDRTTGRLPAARGSLSSSDRTSQRPSACGSGAEPPSDTGVESRSVV